MMIRNTEPAFNFGIPVVIFGKCVGYNDKKKDPQMRQPGSFYNKKTASFTEIELFGLMDFWCRIGCFDSNIL